MARVDEAIVQRVVMPRGAFSLAASTRFLEGFAPAARDGRAPGSVSDDVLRLAFPVEGSWQTAGVEVSQDVGGSVRLVAQSASSAVAEAAVGQALHMLSADLDGSGLADAVAGDPVAAGLVARARGLRPVGFYSPYEAAVWAVVGQRIRIVQAAALKAAIARDLGDVVTVAGTELASFPGPQALLDHALGPDAPAVLGLPEIKVTRLQGVARAALEGSLDSAHLLEMSVDDALAELQEIPGIGPFGSQHIYIRGAMAADVFPTTEWRLLDSMRTAYQRPDADVAELAEIAAGWAPFRSWLSVLFRVEREARTGEIGGGTGRRPSRRASQKRRESGSSKPRSSS